MKFLDVVKEVMENKKQDIQKRKKFEQADSESQNSNKM